MVKEYEVSEHYAKNNLLEAILDGINNIGKTKDSVNIDDLAPIDEFHIGGRQATIHFLKQLDIHASNNILDIGCGLGGASRFAANTFGCHVVGVDLTEDYIYVGTELNRWLGLDSKISLKKGSALQLPIEEAQFDAAFMLHVGMNISDKGKLASEAYKALKPGALFGIYDIMLLQDKEIMYPTPWAKQAELSALSTIETYTSALKNAGFSIKTVQERRKENIEWVKSMQNKLAESSTPAPLGLHILMGEEAKQKMFNMFNALKSGVIAPVEIIAKKRNRS